ncbi:MAG: transcriptional repressor LexA [Deltaproteobacteria bacterium]|nr:transcriptional repressor LexA [Deltaproteobacteria bacterium]NIS78414.1 transcriptional repressor LexA [Deltaproteobacteria bacterium]
MVRELTAKQKKVLEFIKGYVRRNRFAPSAREIAGQFGIAEKNAFYYLDVLQRKGHIRRRKNMPRVLEFTGEDAALIPLTIPVVGRVQAGKPITAVENLEGEVLLDAGLVGGEDAFLLRVRGDSMAGAHIVDGDLVMVRPQKTAENGEIVVALIGDEATVKRIYCEPGRVILRPENPSYDEIVVELSSDGFELIGKVVGVFRKLP